ncbi:MAG: S8 family serine peptidase [Luteolibacter sp.]
MKRYFRPIVASLIIAICGLLGWWLARDFTVVSGKKPLVSKEEATPVKVATNTRHRSRPISRDEFRDGTTVELFASSKPDEVILRFPSEDTYQAFFFVLAKSNIRLVDQLDPLRAMRLSYNDWEELSSLLDGEHITAYDSLPADPAPSPTGGGNQQGLVGFGDSVLSWLGIHGDNSQWGAGVRIAVIDSGVVPHPDLPGLRSSIAITPFPQDLNKTYGHGTAVASLIAGSNALAPGVAPAAELVSIRVGDESGKADSFALAAGIIAALDAKVQIMNISMGTTENNPLIEEAVLLAREQDVLIVAASGNSEQDEACYPAAYPSVISVGSVDARGVHLDFSNFGSFLSLTAPGYSINAAWPGDRYAKISGTSASAPIVTGAIAATMSNGSGVRMRASEAAEIVMKNADEAGLPGPDSEFGSGILNMARVMNRSISGIVDAAITDQRFVRGANGSSDELEVTIQNRGTSILVNTLLEISTPLGSRQFNATTIAPGTIQTFSMPVRLSGLPRNEPIQVNSRITLGTFGQDITPQNNHREDTLYVP